MCLQPASEGAECLWCSDAAIWSSPPAYQHSTLCTIQDNYYSLAVCNGQRIYQMHQATYKWQEMSVAICRSIIISWTGTSACEPPPLPLTRHCMIMLCITLPYLHQCCLSCAFINHHQSMPRSPAGVDMDRSKCSLNIVIWSIAEVVGDFTNGYFYRNKWLTESYPSSGTQIQIHITWSCCLQ